MTGSRNAAAMLNKVPEVTIYFWIIKILATTVGETASDFLSQTLQLGLTWTSAIMAGLLVAALAVQFRFRRYVPWIYWLSVVLISVVGTLISDKLVDDLGVGLQTTTVLFSAALAATFALWYRAERTLSIHTINTGRRELFYWAAVLFTFALGTSGGDLMAEGIGIGYAPALVIFAGAIALVTAARFGFGVNAVLAFWLAYILTRPLGASFGDLLSQPLADGGLALGTVATSALFLAAILSLVAYLAVTRRDVTPEPAVADE